ncbi:alpha/beta hydrolase-fold protein [Streptomyces sp. NPDC008150]|uniref:alpha/beta hydrolase-fold protein n=1 Tax=Streptomyces sp. NPDC008150 TaxID=3364816 RepID=UPI0036F03589
MIHQNQPRSLRTPASPHRRRGSAYLAAVSLLGAGALLTAVPAQATTPAKSGTGSSKQSQQHDSRGKQSPKPQQGSNPQRFSPVVKHTGTGPTGYTVTFRYDDPTATRVQIKGEWSFSDAAHTTTTTSQGVQPEQWTRGDFPIAYPNAVAANWPVRDLKQGKDGVWSLTLPLPSGVFTYGFFVNCASDTGSGCTERADPANPPWNVVDGVSVGTAEPDSEVYVPSDPRFGTADFSWEAPAPAGKQGRLADVSYPSPQSTAPVGTHPLAVYTPPGYNPKRSAAYPTLYLSHGAGGNEVDWSTQGAAGAILDNLIATGRVQPMVVVMTNFNGIPGGAAGYADDLLDNVVPYVQSHYNVSDKVADRAFAGLSAGGARANTLLFDHTAEFGYYSVMSNAGGTPASLTDAQVTALKGVLGLQVGSGIQDPIRANTTNEQAALTAAGIAFQDDSVNGGHEWYVWRTLLHDFVAQQAFKTTTTKATVATDRKGKETVTASVTAATSGAAPTGTVQFTVDGVTYGNPVRLSHGSAAAELKGLQGGSHTVVATYSGDALHRGSQTTVTG